MSELSKQQAINNLLVTQNLLLDKIDGLNSDLDDLLRICHQVINKHIRFEDFVLYVETNFPNKLTRGNTND